MKGKDVQVGECYVAKVSGKPAKVRITGESPHGGWDAVNTATNRPVRIRGAGRLRKEQADADSHAQRPWAFLTATPPATTAHTA